METVGQIVGGDYDEILIRQRSDARIELGELLVADDILLMVYDLEYGSLMDSKAIHRLSGANLEGMGKPRIYDERIRNFNIVKARCLLDLRGNRPKIPKRLPQFLTEVRRITPEDLGFLREFSDDKIYVGKLRSGNRVLEDFPIYLPLESGRGVRDLISHHILITATTGRGKSNLVKVMLGSLLKNERCGIIVFDAHNEYYGGKGIPGLKEHPDSEYIRYFTTKPSSGEYEIRINLRDVKPWHLRDVGEFTDAQEQAMYLYYRAHRNDWIVKVFEEEDEAEELGIRENTMAVLQRKLQRYLGIEYTNGRIISHSIFSVQGGEQTVDMICRFLEEGKKVIVDTSLLDSTTEILTAGIIAEAIFSRYRRYKEEGSLDSKAVVGIVMEEAPRVLSGDRSNVFGTIAREGRKFSIGLIAITQLVSLIPHEVLANMNTKIILGVEMRGEREKIVSSCAQDLSKESKMISSLDKGEAIISSIFTKFPVPVYVERYEDYLENVKKDKKERKVIMALDIFQ